MPPRIDRRWRKAVLKKSTARFEVNVTADTESLTAYVHPAGDAHQRHRKGTEGEHRGGAARLRPWRRCHARPRYPHGQLDPCPRSGRWNSCVNGQIAESSAVERSVENYNGLTGTQSAPQRDTSWHPYDVLVDDVDSDRIRATSAWS
jgi:hypothetical protein